MTLGFFIYVGELLCMRDAKLVNGEVKDLRHLSFRHLVRVDLTGPGEKSLWVCDCKGTGPSRFLYEEARICYEEKSNNQICGTLTEDLEAFGLCLHSKSVYWTSCIT